MNVVALADFGSTFTKVTLVEAGSGRLVATGSAPTTVVTDVMEGYAAAMDDALSAAPAAGATVEARLACSSAGGGLRMAAVGLVPELTAAAARMAALNAGARVELVLAGTLGDKDCLLLESCKPEIVLFSGGTDGGQADFVLENARVLSRAKVVGHMIVACNAVVAGTVAEMFAHAGWQVKVVANVMPQIRALNIGPARQAILDTFINHVIHGKGLSRTKEFGESVLMPTPEAVLRATSLLAAGTESEAGFGDLVVVDVGGATTDIHSALVDPPRRNWVQAGDLPLPSVMRSVQGDLGMRWSAPGVFEADGLWLTTELADTGWNECELRAKCEQMRVHPELLAAGPNERLLDQAIAVSCISLGLRRHSGTMSIGYRRDREVDFIQKGADLRDVGLIIGSGGVLAHDPEAARLLDRAAGRREKGSLAPVAPRIALDVNYVLPAAGLLSTRNPLAALTLIKTEVRGVSNAA